MSQTSQPIVTEELLNELGQLVLEGAFMRYLAGRTEFEIEEFESFVAHQAESENFVAAISAHYPDFKTILEEEVQTFLLQKKV